MERRELNALVRDRKSSVLIALGLSPQLQMANHLRCFHQSRSFLRDVVLCCPRDSHTAHPVVRDQPVRFTVPVEFRAKVEGEICALEGVIEELLDDRVRGQRD